MRTLSTNGKLPYQQISETKIHSGNTHPHCCTNSFQKLQRQYMQKKGMFMKVLYKAPNCASKTHVNHERLFDRLLLLAGLARTILPVMATIGMDPGLLKTQSQAAVFQTDRLMFSM